MTLDDLRALPKVDAHTHLFHDRAGLLDVMERWHLSAVVIHITGKNLWPAPMDARWAAMRAMREAHPDRFALCTTFDPDGIDAPDFAERVIAGLRADLDAGAVMVKVWKDVGLELRDASGEFVTIDDRRFRPIWDFLATEGVPVLAHIAEPRAAWRPLDRRSPHYAYYSTHPQYHLYLRDDVLSYEGLIESRDRWIAQNPHLTIVGAHFGSNEHDVAEVARRLDRFPNYFVDTAERFGDLVIQDSADVRDFFVRYADRVLYGTDVIVDTPPDAHPEAEQRDEMARYEALLESHVAYLTRSGPVEVADKLVEPVTVPGLDLPEAALVDLYANTARRVLSLDPVAA